MPFAINVNSHIVDSTIKKYFFEDVFLLNIVLFDIIQIQMYEDCRSVGGNFVDECPVALKYSVTRSE